MAFTTQTVTTKGSEALASATVNNRLIIVGCDADTTVLDNDQALAIENRPASPVSTSTNVTSLGDNSSGHINARAYFQAGVTTGGNANTLYLYGHLESAPSTNFVIFVASDPVGFHLPASGDVASEWQILFDIVYTPQAGAVGYATQATYATEAELEIVAGNANRAVTTHSANDPTVGDAQTILGAKTFSSALTASAGVTTTTLSASGNATVGGTLGVTGNTTVGGTLGVTGATTLSSTLGVTGNTTVGGTFGVTGATTLSTLTCTTIGSQGHNPSSNSTSDSSGYSLGTSSYRWRNLYARNGYFSNEAAIGGTLSVTGATTLSSTLGVTGNTTVGGSIKATNEIETSSWLSVTGMTSAVGGITSGSDILPSVSSTSASTGYDLGNSYNVWRQVYARSATFVNGADIGGSTRVASLEVTDSLSGLNTSLYGSGKGALVRLKVSGTWPDTLVRGTEIYDGLATLTSSISIASDEYTVTSDSRFKLLHALAPQALADPAVEVDAIVTVA